MTLPEPARTLIDIAKSVTKPDAEVIRALIQNTPNIDSTDDNGYTALHWAAYNGHEDMARQLIDSGANLYARDNFGKVPAALASENFAFGRTNDVAAIHQRKANIYKYLLMQGSPYHTFDTNSPNELATLRTCWFDECSQSWHTWVEKQNADVTLITPKRLIQFVSHGTDRDALSPERWRGHEDHLRQLIISPDIPPCHIQRWLAENPWLTATLETPQPRILGNALEHQPLASGLATRAQS